MMPVLTISVYPNGMSLINTAHLAQWSASCWVLRVWQMAEAEYLFVITSQLSLGPTHPPAQCLLVHSVSIWL
jgi:hypothetical protein